MLPNHLMYIIINNKNQLVCKFFFERTIYFPLNIGIMTKCFIDTFQKLTSFREFVQKCATWYLTNLLFQTKQNKFGFTSQFGSCQSTLIFCKIFWVIVSPTIYKYIYLIWFRYLIWIIYITFLIIVVSFFCTSVL